LYLKALEVADERQRRDLLALYAENTLDEESKVQSVKSLFTDLNVMTMAEEEKQRYQKEAISFLSKLEALGRNCSELRGFSEMLMGREK